MVVPITDVVKMTLSVADISVKPIIGTPLVQVCSYNKQTSANDCVHITQLTILHDVMYDV